MTALNFILDPEYVLITMDTLCSKPNKEPLNYVSKIIPLPHLKSVICGTGAVDLILDWYILIEKQIVARDIYKLDKLAPEQLNKLAQKYMLNESNTSATIYQFGFSEAYGRFKGFAYRSENNFRSETLNDGFGLKPQSPEIIQYYNELFRARGTIDLDLLIELMKYQKINDGEKDKTERVGIGGSIHLCRLDKYKQFLWECYAFEDYEEMWNKMLKNL